MTIATNCYLEQDGKYLMLYRNKKKNDMHEGYWVVPGGKLEPGETPEECVIREFYEESGLTLIDPALKGVLTFPDDGLSGGWLVFLFHAAEAAGELKPCDEGELEWVEKDKLNDLRMHGGDYHFIKLMQDCKGVFSAKLDYDGKEFKKMTLMGEYP